MSRYLLPLITFMLFWGVPPHLLAEDSSFKKDVETTVVDTVDASKDFFSGVVAGITKAAKGSPEFDPAHIVSNKASLAKLLQVKVLSAQEKPNKHWVLTVSLHNEGDAKVLVTQLSVLGQILVLDADHFAYHLMDSKKDGQSVVVLPRSAARLVFNFKDLESRPTIFRIYDTDFPIPPTLRD